MERHSAVVVYILVLVFFVWTGISTADNFDDAENKANRFYDKYNEVRNLDVSELKALVKALCEAEEEERQSVARDAASRVKDNVDREYRNLEDRRKEALEALDAVLRDETFKDKWSRAEDHKKRIEQYWETIKKMTEGVRGSNNPVTAFMLAEGQKAHLAYQENSSNCTVHEWSLPSGKADCINASSCEVIELKPNNSRSIYRGRDQGGRYRDTLNQDSAKLEELAQKDSRFRECKEKFKARVACYTLCPEIDDEGNMRSMSVGWGFCD